MKQLKGCAGVAEEARKLEQDHPATVKSRRGETSKFMCHTYPNFLQSTVYMTEGYSTSGTICKGLCEEVGNEGFRFGKGRSSTRQQPLQISQLASNEDNKLG